jgi:8-oxo-dGTP pyrophosphatase MutT (NUDIX family)
MTAVAAALDSLTIDDIRAALAARWPQLHEVVPDVTRVHAAVAIIARPAARDVELLFIRRAAFANDPWSGDIAFPGGRIGSPVEPPHAAAERETLEEVGVDLTAADPLGRLDDVIGGGGAVVVSGFVYALSTPVTLRTNHEVASAGWVPTRRFIEPARQSTKTFRYQDRDVRLPAVTIFDDDSPPLWGLTYQFVERFLRLLGREIPTMPWKDSG